jgi:hypothetical protein
MTRIKRIATTAAKGKTGAKKMATKKTCKQATLRKWQVPKWVRVGDHLRMVFCEGYDYGRKPRRGIKIRSK